MSDSKQKSAEEIVRYEIVQGPTNKSTGIHQAWIKECGDGGKVICYCTLDMAPTFIQSIREARARSWPSDKEVEQAMNERYFVDDVWGRASRLDFKEGARWLKEWMTRGDRK